MASNKHDELRSMAASPHAPSSPPAASRPRLFPALARPAREPASVATLWAVYTFEVLIVAALRIPHDLGLFMFAFGDRGSWLVVQYLVAHGYRPTIDFGFPYGLLPLMLGQAWFGLLGLTPAAFELAMVAGGVAMAWGIARFASAMRLSRVAQALMIIVLPIAIQSSLPSLSHMLEAVLLCLALGEHSRGNRGAALALATAACFAKPALAYLYGFLLLILIVAACRRRSTAGATAKIDWSALGWKLRPAVITGVTLMVVLGAVFGARPLLASLLPLNGMKIYRTMHFGFFTPWSRTFWDPTQQGSLGQYLGQVAAFWMAATVWLALAAIAAGWRMLMSPADDLPSRRRDEIIFCCGVMQTLFVLRFFGPPMSWTYYPYMLVMGVTASAMVGGATALAAGVLALIAIPAQLIFFAGSAMQWKTHARSPVTAGLWADSSERAEWSTVERLIAGHRAVAVGVAGGAPLLAPNFAPPIGAYLVPSEATPDEVARTIARIKTAQMVVRPASESIGDPISFWPELTRALDQLEVVWKGHVYQVCRRRPVPANN